MLERWFQKNKLSNDVNQSERMDLQKLTGISHISKSKMSVIRGEVAEAPVRILSPATRKHMACRLDSRKILLASPGVHR